MAALLGRIWLFLVLALCHFSKSICGTLQDVSLADYQEYLESKGKGLDRLQDGRRFAQFQATAKFVASHFALYYNVGLNELADWLPHEMPSSSVHSAAASSTSSIPALGKKAIKAMAHRGTASIDDALLMRRYNRETRSVHDAERYLRQLRQKRKTQSSSSSSFFGGLGFGADDGWGEDGDSGGINWGSTNNPYNVSIVGEVSNQGACGACWSFVATAAVEAAVYMASKVHVRLSEQELIDCDTDFNRGCGGGNPVYAFEFIIKHGLTNEASYPYAEEQHAVCRREQYVSKASIRGYLRLPTNDQELIKEFLKLGPIATGICGTDPSFLYYTGGLYDPPDCCQEQNHAVLIVGYGYDAVAQREYFHIKNSWGVYWGEEGYMRLAISGLNKNTDDLAAFENPVSDTSPAAAAAAAREGAQAAMVVESGTCGVAVGPSLPTDGSLEIVERTRSHYMRGKREHHDKHDDGKDKDDDSYTDDNPSAPVIQHPTWFHRHWYQLYFWWEVHRGTVLYLLSLFFFVCSCSLCMYTLYDDFTHPVELQEPISVTIREHEEVMLPRGSSPSGRSYIPIRVGASPRV